MTTCTSLSTESNPWVTVSFCDVNVVHMRILLLNY